jgi:hypothetical protein
MLRKRNCLQNAKGDVFNASGDIFNASGDVFNYATNPLPGKTEDQIMAGWRDGSISDADYYAWLDYQEGVEPQSEQSGFMKWTDWLFGKADQTADIINKFKNEGTNVEDEGVSYDIEAGQQKTKSNTIWYIAGGVVALLIVVAVVMARKKK